MKDLVVTISLYGRTVGYASWDNNRGSASFEFEPKFINSGLNVSPLIMPLAKSKGRVYNFPENINNCFGGLPGMLSDSLPDKYGSEKIDAYFASKGLLTSDVTPLDRLCYIGKRGMGALEFEPSNSYKDLEESSGAKAKAIIAYNDETNEVRSGQVKAPEGFGYWLLKFDGGEFLEHNQICENPKGIGQIEYAYYKMAKAAGIDMNECRLLEEGDSHHFMTRRFDRTMNGEKIHMQTLAAIAHYNRDERHSYEQLFEVMRKLDLPYTDYKEMFRRMVFNVAARNHDDHTKNHSFLMDRNGKWSLAPAYDLCYSYNKNGKFTKYHQMFLNGKQDNFTYKDLKNVADNIGIKFSENIINEVMDVTAEWKSFAKEAGVRREYSEEINDNILSLKSSPGLSKGIRR